MDTILTGFFLSNQGVTYNIARQKYQNLLLQNHQIQNHYMICFQCHFVVVCEFAFLLLPEVGPDFVRRPVRIRFWGTLFSEFSKGHFGLVCPASVQLVQCLICRALGAFSTILG